MALSFPFVTVRKERLRLAENKAIAAERSFHSLGLQPVDETSADDIFITGYPKSGNTWVQIMMAAVLFGFDVQRTPFTLMCEAVPDLSDRQYYRRHGPIMVYKSHALPSPNYRRVIYLVRDGRDVMVSYRHYREVVDRATYALEQFVNENHEMWPCHWHAHVDAWTANPYGCEMLFVQYEDLVADPVGQLQRICRFARLVRPVAQLRAIVNATSLDHLRSKEQREGGIPVAQYAGDKPFFRRGQIGSHLDEMSPEALAIFMRHARPTLERWGYVEAARPGSEASLRAVA